MPGIVSSIASLPAATSLFAVRQVVQLVGGRSTDRVQKELYCAEKFLQQRLESEALFFGAYQVSNEAQSATLRLFRDLAHGRFLDFRWIAENSDSLSAWAARAGQTIASGANARSYVQLLRNTRDVINLVNRASTRLDLPPGPIDLNEAVARAYSVDDYSALWLVEGLGQEYADRNWAGKRTEGLFKSGVMSDVPRKSLLMLHAGMGIAYAKRTVGALTPLSSPEETDAALQRFLYLVDANSRSDYRGPALESLGLVTRAWYAELVPKIDERLQLLDIEALEYFWHGAGRAIYFNPLYLLPGFGAFTGAARDARYELARRNALAGAAWAFTLVNLKTPEVMADLLANSPATVEDPAFTNGMMSVLIMASDMVPNDRAITDFCEYVPAGRGAEFRGRWAELIQNPCRAATSVYLPALSAQGIIGEVFQYRILSELASSTKDSE